MVDVSSIYINCDINTIFNFMYDINKINLWSLGITWINNNNKDEIYKGISNYDNSISYMKITINEKIKQIKYWIGNDINNLNPRIYVYVIQPEKTNINKLSMLAFRTKDMNDERWNKLINSHISEIKIIKNLIENIIK